MPRRRKPKWDETRIIEVLDRMSKAYEADDPKHMLSLLDGLEIVAMEVIGSDADEAFDLMKKLRTELEKELVSWRPPLKGKLPRKARRSRRVLK